MTVSELLEKVIERGISAAKRDYSPKGGEDPEYLLQKEEQLKGSIAGFEACRGKLGDDLLRVKDEASKATEEARSDAMAGIIPKERYWYYRCFEAEVDWVINCISAAIGINLSPLMAPTYRAQMTVLSILDEEPKGNQQTL